MQQRIAWLSRRSERSRVSKRNNVEKDQRRSSSRNESSEAERKIEKSEGEKSFMHDRFDIAVNALARRSQARRRLLGDFDRSSRNRTRDQRDCVRLIVNRDRNPRTGSYRFPRDRLSSNLLRWLTATRYQPTRRGEATQIRYGKRLFSRFWTLLFFALPPSGLEHVYDTKKSNEKLQRTIVRSVHSATTEDGNWYNARFNGSAIDSDSRVTCNMWNRIECLFAVKSTRLSSSFSFLYHWNSCKIICD